MVVLWLSLCLGLGALLGVAWMGLLDSLSG